MKERNPFWLLRNQKSSIFCFCFLHDTESANLFLSWKKYFFLIPLAAKNTFQLELCFREPDETFLRNAGQRHVSCELLFKAPYVLVVCCYCSSSAHSRPAWTMAKKEAVAAAAMASGAAVSESVQGRCCSTAMRCREAVVRVPRLCWRRFYYTGEVCLMRTPTVLEISRHGRGTSCPHGSWMAALSEVHYATASLV